MKINTFTAILSIALAGIIAFFLSFYVSGDNKLLLGIGSFVSMALTLTGTLSLSFEYDRTTTLMEISIFQTPPFRLKQPPQNVT